MPILNQLAAQLMQCIAINLENSPSSPTPLAPIAASLHLDREGAKPLQGPAGVMVGLIGTACVLS
jgi:hypothetical protein